MWQWIVANQQLVIAGIAILYALLPATSPIKIFINNLLAKIGITPPTPTPTPVPGPTPTPTPNPLPIPSPGVDLQTLLQLLMSILVKTRSSGDAKAQEAVLTAIDLVKAEADSLSRSAPQQESSRVVFIRPF